MGPEWYCSQVELAFVCIGELFAVRIVIQDGRIWLQHFSATSKWNLSHRTNGYLVSRTHVGGRLRLGAGISSSIHCPEQGSAQLHVPTLSFDFAKHIELSTARSHP